MNPITVTLVVGITTVLASGVASSAMTYCLTRSKEQMVFMRSKAEHLYLSADEYGTAFSVNMVGYLPLLEGKIDYNEMLDTQIKGGSNKREHGGAETMTMLSEIYFPSTREALKRIWEARDRYNDVTGLLKRIYVDRGSLTDPQCRVAFLKASADIDEAIADLKTEIVKAAHRYAGVRQQIKGK